MTITTGLLMLIIVALAVKMKGAQIPHVVLGALLMASASTGSFVDTMGADGVDLVNRVVNAVASALGNGNIV